MLRTLTRIILISLYSSFLFAQSSNCLPHFPYQQSWLGADAAYSIALPNHKVLWLFGDTFIQSNHKTSREGAQMLANTIALSHCNNGKFNIDYYWRHDNSTNKPFFINENKKEIYWPADGFYYHDAVYVTLRRVQRLNQPGPFAFKIVGTVLAKITALEKAPADWQIDYIPLFENDNLLPGNAIILHDSYAYFYTGVKTNKQSYTGLLRLRLDQLTHNNYQFELLDKQQQWTRDLSASDAAAVMPTDPSEMSVTPTHEGYLAIYSPALSKHIVYSTAQQLTGPWSTAKQLYQYPEIAKDNRVFCYAAKAHSEYSSAETLVFSYVCNSTDFNHLINDLSIYHPMIAQVKH